MAIVQYILSWGIVESLIIPSYLATTNGSWTMRFALSSFIETILIACWVQSLKTDFKGHPLNPTRSKFLLSTLVLAEVIVSLCVHPLNSSTLLHKSLRIVVLIPHFLLSKLRRKCLFFIKKFLRDIQRYRETLAVLKPYLAPYTRKGRSSLLICIGLMLLETPLNLLETVYRKEVVDSVSINLKDSTSTSSPGTDTNSSCSYSSEENLTSLSLNIQFRWQPIVIEAALGLITGGLISSLTTYFWRFVEDDGEGRLQLEVFKKLHAQSHRWHLEKGTGDSISRLQYASRSFMGLLSHFLFTVCPQWIELVVTLFYLVSVYPLGLTISVVLTTFVLVSMRIILSFWQKKSVVSQKEATKEKLRRSFDSIMNYETVKFFGREEYEAEQYDKLYKIIREKKHKVSFLSQLGWYAETVMWSLGETAINVWCYWIIIHDKELTTGDYIIFSSYYYKVLSPITDISWIYGWCQDTFVEGKEVQELLREVPEIMDMPNGCNPLVVSEGRIVFENVSFSYLPEKKVLDSFSLTLEPGKTYGLVGATGAGKSTIMKLMFRFYDPTDGRILIDGQDIKNVPLSSLRQSIAVVPQDTTLFDETLSYNIRYGSSSQELDKVSEEDFENAAKFACIHEDILKFPDKYESKVGERGLKLSGGERQRISIARAVLKKAKILLLDEATSSLDTNTESQVLSNLQPFMKDCTTIIVAHRLTTIVNADEIIVMKGGRIVEKGSHSELLAVHGGLYNSMWSKQLRDHDTDVDDDADTSSGSL